MPALNEVQVRAIVNQMLQKGQYSVPKTSFHTHNGIDSPSLASSGSSISINGLATGTAVTSIPANTPTLLEPTQVFANGVTFNVTGSDYGWTIVTAGQYIITSLVGYTSTQSGWLYQNIIKWTPTGGSLTTISNVNNSGGSGTEMCFSGTIIYNLGVGDLIQLYTEEQYSGGGTVSNLAYQTYLAIAKV